MTPFAELIAATNFSFLRGASHAHEMVGRAAELGLAAIGIADRNTLAGVVRAHTAAKEHNIRCLVGARLVTPRRLRGGLLSHRPRGLRPAVPPADRRQPARRQGPVPFHASRRSIAASEGQIFIVVPPRQLAPTFSRAPAYARPLPRAGRTYLAAVFAYDGNERRRLGRARPRSRARRARRSSPPTTRSITTPPASRSPTCSPASARNARLPTPATASRPTPSGT